MKEYSLIPLAGQAGLRLDIFILDFSQKNNLGYSRTFIQKLIQEGRVALKGEAILKPHYKIKPGDAFKVTVEDKKSGGLEAEAIPLDIIYEDEDIAVINKDAGMVVHPAPGNYEHTLVNAILYRIKRLSDINPARPGIVHRLDKETSGILVVAKNNPSHLALARQFAQHSIVRKYVAIVKGRVEFDENVIDLPIGRHPVRRKDMAVGFSEKTKYAKTHYRLLKRAKQFSLLELKPFTGRTHQLRVHLSFIGHPIIGDTKYGKDTVFGRLALHAKYLGFIHPSSKKFVEFSCAIPDEFNQFMDKNKS
ncbi:MAG TPA: RluA family pseudouridine synthase [Candidatus Margulisiibacteriota bacterium]|nr:RluA family pseudouridine synthase [Candidatus Margulisiibacteriota bacterium]